MGRPGPYLPHTPLLREMASRNLTINMHTLYHQNGKVKCLKKYERIRDRENSEATYKSEEWPAGILTQTMSASLPCLDDGDV